MPKNQLSIMDHKEIIPLTIERMTVYLRSKIIEAVSENGDLYYLFFYNNVYLTAMKTNRLKCHSFIEHSFKKGVTLHFPNPIIFKLVSTDHPYKVFTLTQLAKKLKNPFSSQEIAFILTFFESFISKKILFHEIQEIFYTFRRNGQMFAGYQILRILSDFIPKNSWVKQMLHDLSFKKYANLYEQFSEKLLEKDQIFAEKLLFNGIEKQEYFDLLISTLKKDGLSIDILALYINRIIYKPSSESYHILLQQLEAHFSKEEICQILIGLSSELPQLQELHLDLFNRLLNLDQFEEAIQLLIDHKFLLGSLQPESYHTLINHIQTEPGSIPFEKLNELFIPLAVSEPEEAEKALQACVTSLFKNHDITYIQKWLEPIKAGQPSLPIFQKMDKIERLGDDPNKQLVLGELYYQLMQFDRAIECFSWEMELNQEDPRPVQWLAKIYRKLNMNSEYDAYQQLLISMNK